MSDRVALKVPWRDLILITEISTGLRQSYLLLVSTPATPRSLHRYTTFHSGMDAKVSQQRFWPLPWEWAHDDKTMPYKLYVSFKSSCPSCGTLDLSEFNVNVMTGNNGAHQRTPYDPGIQKWPFFFVQTPEFFLPLWSSWYSLQMTISLKWKKFWGLDKKERSFLNHWVIRRTLVCSVVSGHDLDIKFW